MVRKEKENSLGKSTMWREVLSFGMFMYIDFNTYFKQVH